MTFTAMRPGMGLPKRRAQFLFLAGEFGEAVGEGIGDAEVHSPINPHARVD